MSIPITIGGTTYNYPTSGDDPNWSQDATDAIVAMADALATLLGSGDILETTFSIANNIVSPVNVNGLLFDPGTVRASTIDYAIYRTSTETPSGNVESGTCYIIYDDSAPAGTKWQLSQRKDSDSGVALSVTDQGQFQYISTDIGDTNYVGSISFRAKSFAKV